MNKANIVKTIERSLRKLNLIGLIDHGGRAEVIFFVVYLIVMRKLYQFHGFTTVIPTSWINLEQSIGLTKMMRNFFYVMKPISNTFTTTPKKTLMNL